VKLGQIYQGKFERNKADGVVTLDGKDMITLVIQV